MGAKPSRTMTMFDCFSSYVRCEINDSMNDCLNKISKSNIIYIGNSFISLAILKTHYDNVPLNLIRFNSMKANIFKISTLNMYLDFSDFRIFVIREQRQGG